MTGPLPLLVILGPTASGKTALALALAAQCQGEILSVDSMQVYQGLEIGTAKPSRQERQKIPHHLMDCLPPDEVFSVARFVELADQTIAQAAARGTNLIAVGGTPLYFKALFQGLFAGPGADQSLRQNLRALSGEELHQRLRQADPLAARRIHAADHKRLIRALEVFQLTGQPISGLQRQWESKAPARHAAVWIGLRCDRETLNRRINARVKEMIAAGWVQEVRQLLEQYPHLSKTARQATGYAQLIDHVQGKIELEEAVEGIKIATRQLARRQMKWFKRFGQVHWLEADRSLEQNLQDAQRLWQAGTVV